MVRASALSTVDSGSMPSRVKPMTLKLVFTASLLDAQHYGDSVENKPASLLVVPLGKALNGIVLRQRHGLAVPRAGYRSYVTGSIHGWSRRLEERKLTLQSSSIIIQLNFQFNII